MLGEEIMIIELFNHHKFLSNKVINFVINMILAIGTVLPFMMKMCLKSKKTINRFFTLFTYFLSAMPLMNTFASFSQVSGGTAYNGLLSVELSPVGIEISSLPMLSFML